MIGLTSAQAECLSILEKAAASKGPCPSFEELKQALGIHSKSGVARIIVALEEKGRIRRLPNRARAIEVLSADAEPLRKFPTKMLLDEIARRSEANRDRRAA